MKHLSSLDEFQGGVDTGDFEAPVVPSAFYGFGNGIMKYFVYNDPDWTYEDYDFDTLARDSARIADTLNATDPDLSSFRDRGGKLILYSGWSDAAVPAAGVIGYYEAVLAHDQTAAADVRLFMMPGVEHCFGGPGPSWLNYLEVIDTWVEAGEAPDQLTAFWLNEQMQPEGSRPVCAYPAYPVYKGSGDPRDASSFSCVAGK